MQNHAVIIALCKGLCC